MASYDRQDSILTEEQRKTIVGASDVEREGAHKRNFESAIRKRVRNGLSDFAILSGVKGPGFDERNLRLIFNSLHSHDNAVAENKKSGQVPKVRSRNDSMPAWIRTTYMVSFAYQGLRAIGNDPDSIMSNAIMRGVLMGEAKHRGVDRSLVGIDWSFDLAVHEQAEADSLEKWKRDLPLSTDERAELHEQLIEAVPEEVYQEATPMDFDDLVEEYLVSEE